MPDPFDPFFDDDDDDSDDDGESDPLAYEHPKFVFCSRECIRDAESDYWEEVAEDRAAAERARHGLPEDIDDEADPAEEEEKEEEEEEEEEDEDE